jgi:hypothetical protein
VLDSLNRHRCSKQKQTDLDNTLTAEKWYIHCHARMSYRSILHRAKRRSFPYPSSLLAVPQLLIGLLVGETCEPPTWRSERRLVREHGQETRLIRAPDFG